MATQETPSIKSRFEAFSKSAHLELLLPRSDDSGILKILQNGSPEDLSRLPSRRNLFFGSLMC